MGLVLYASKVSPPSRAVMMLIEILGLDVQFKEVTLPKRDHYNSEYINKNPLHTIPMLEDDGFTIVDSHAIMTYLVSKFESNKDLYPVDLKKRSLVDQRLYFDATVLFPRLRNVIYSITKGETTGLTAMQREDIEEAYGFMETYLERTTFVAGDSLSVADLACVATLSSLHHIVVINKKYVRIQQWWDKLQNEPWYLTQNSHGAVEFGFFMAMLLGRFKRS